jgi:hypothetical protein
LVATDGARQELGLVQGTAACATLSARRYVGRRPKRWGKVLSTILYASLQSRRQRASEARAVALANNQAAPPPPEVTPFVDALAALVPAELLAAHAAIIAIASTKVHDATSITNTGTLKAVWWIFVVGASLLYVLSRLTTAHGSKLTWWDIPRFPIPAISFVAWTMLQPASMFDAVSHASKDQRSIWAIVIAVGVAAVAAALSYTVKAE